MSFRRFAAIAQDRGEDSCSTPQRTLPGRSSICWELSSSLEPGALVARTYLIARLKAFEAGDRKKEMVSGTFADRYRKPRAALFADRDFGGQGTSSIGAPKARARSATRLRAAPTDPNVMRRAASRRKYRESRRLLWGRRRPVSHLRGQVARHFHAHADLTNFRCRPCHGVVSFYGLASSVLPGAGAKARVPWRPNNGQMVVQTVSASMGRNSLS